MIKAIKLIRSICLTGGNQRASANNGTANGHNQKTCRCVEKWKSFWWSCGQYDVRYLAEYILEMTWLVYFKYYM